jgi:hypothetical protein
MGWALASWMRQPREQRVELRLRLMEKILRLVRIETYQELLLDTIQSYYKLSRAEAKAEERLLRSGRYGEVEELTQTVLGRLAAKERRETLQQAVQQAILTRFPEAPASLVERVERVRNQVALEELLRRVILAPSLVEVEALLSG